MSKDYNDIVSGNEDYQKHKKRNQFLYHSYLGGEAYKRGEYLTRYVNESESDYQERVSITPLDNHCAGVISLYNSFIFRVPPVRDYGSLEGDPAVAQFENDADLEGRSINSFMKEANTVASVFGVVWIVLSKPNSNALTRADELNQNIRPYASIVSPLMMLDWNYTRSVSGHYVLDYVKYVEESNSAQTVIKQWYPEVVVTTIVDNERNEVSETITEVNGLGIVPVIAHYANRTSKRGVGIGLIQDIADLQRAIYQEYSEIEQTIRLSNAASLVKTPDTEAGAGPGAVIHMPDNIDPALKPYLLQPSGASVAAIYESINNKVAAIDRIAHLGAIRETTARSMSGVSRQMEFEQLNSKLSEIADNLELTEEQIFRLFAQYQGTAWDGIVNYPDSFNIKDANSDLDFYIRALAAPVNSTTYRREVETAIAQTVLGGDSDSLAAIHDEVWGGFEPHYMVNASSGDRVYAANETEHMQYMAAGYSEES